VYVEFWGILDKQEYNNNKKMKKKFYNEEGIDLIDLYPDNLVNLDWYFTNRLLHILKKRQGIYRKKSV